MTLSREAATQFAKVLSEALPFISTMSRAKPVFSSSLSIALPPYLMTSVLPTNRRM